MRADFHDALTTVFIHEGGSAFTDHPADPGGATKHGISLRFLLGEGLDLDHDGDIDADDVKGLTVEQATVLYGNYFWTPTMAENFEHALASKVFDVAVNVGVKRATILLQKAALVEADGLLGPKTFRAVVSANPRLLLANLCRVQTDFYENLAAEKPKLAVFLEGWKVRANCTVYDPCKTCLWKGRKALP